MALFISYFFNSLFHLNLFFEDIIFSSLNALDPLYFNGFELKIFQNIYEFPKNMSFFFAIKFFFAIGFLILIRGGTPRYRYDYLTKLGWLKFLGLVILLFLFSIIFIFIF